MSEWVVFGKTGQLGRALFRAQHQDDISLSFYNRSTFDFSHSASETRAFLSELPQSITGIIIAAAYTQVDKAELEPAQAFIINTQTPSIIAEYCAETNRDLIHISTDYVFSGEARSPYITSHVKNPRNWYGQTKSLSEEYIKKSGANAAIIRTSWVFDGSSKNFLTTMLNLSHSRNVVKVVSDQIGRPTYAGHLADCVLKVARSLSNMDQAGCAYLHATGSGDPISWSEFARAIFNAAEKDIRVEDILSSEFNARAVRPAYSVLDMSSLKQFEGLDMPGWKAGLNEAILERRTTRS